MVEAGLDMKPGKSTKSTGGGHSREQIGKEGKITEEKEHDARIRWMSEHSRAALRIPTVCSKADAHARR